VTVSPSRRVFDLPLLLLALILTLVPLAVSGWTYNIETVKETTFQVGTALLLMAMTFGRAESFGFLRRMDWVVMAYFCANFVSFLFSQVQDLGVAQLQVLGYQLLFYLLVRSLALDARRFDWLTGLLLGSAVITSVVAIVQVVGGYTVRFGVPWETRATGTFVQPTFLGAFLSVTLPLALQRILRPVEGRRRWVTGLGAFLLMLTGLLLSLSRSGWLAALVGVFVLVLMDRGLVPAFRSLLPFAVAMLVVFGLLLWWRPPTNLDLSRMNPRSSRSNQERVAIWSGSVRMVLDRPVLGFGPGNFAPCFVVYAPPFLQEISATENMRALHAHSEVLHVAVESGLVGLGLWLAALALAVRVLLEQGPELEPDEVNLRRLHLAMLAALLVTASIGLDGRFATSSMLLWYLLGMAASRERAARTGGTAVRLPLLLAMAVYLMWLPLDALEADHEKMVGASMHMTDRPKGALFHLANASMLRPADSETHFLRGRNFVALKDYPGAESSYLEALRLDPFNPALCYNLAKVYIRTGQFDKARRLLQMAVKVNPRFELAQRELERLERW
jgi:O-antigen ligase